jgi:hypothetical protein
MPAGAITYSTLAASLYTGTTAGLAAVYNQMPIPAVRVLLPPSPAFLRTAYRCPSDLHPLHPRATLHAGRAGGRGQPDCSGGAPRWCHLCGLGV